MSRSILKKPPVLLLVFSVLLIAADIIFGLKVIGAQRTELSSLEDRVSRLRPGSGAASSVDSFKKGLPDANELTGILKEVLESARRNDLKAPAGSYSPEAVKDTDISRYTISLPVEGRYQQIKRFIYEIESSKRPVVIEEITLASGRGEDGAIGLNIRLSAYYR
ncbi:MAG: type 4a pilus biogenesis protein PilO [Deltaproteobacteria bacterium]|nr:type 4a pilus biogenesis protein PilO [Deltaproteobacteria bacterium]